MNIVFISDTHGFHEKVQVPDGDVLVFAGDWTQNSQNERQQFLRFSGWLNSQPHEYKLFIPGNHDFLAQHDPEFIRRTCGEAHLLLDSHIEIDGLTFYGSPWTPQFYDWAFMAPRHEMAEKWASIPDNTDVLITHGPPFGVLDVNHHGIHCGCEALMERVRELDLLLHVFGHIHESWGVHPARGNEPGYINAACWDHHSGKIRGGVRARLERRAK